MLSTITLYSLLLPLAVGAALKDTQVPLVQNSLGPSLEHGNLTGLPFKKFLIEEMGDVKYLLHHHAAKALLGDQSYVLLRQAEIQERESAVWEYLWNHDLYCEDRPESSSYSDGPPKIYMSDGRVFDADPEHVPQDVIVALQELEEQESKRRMEFRRHRYCELTRPDDASDHVVEAMPDTTEDEWKIDIPEEYLRYLIPRSVQDEEDQRMDSYWQEKQKEDEKKILAGGKSVRNVELPDLRRCKKLDKR